MPTQSGQIDDRSIVSAPQLSQRNENTPGTSKNLDQGANGQMSTNFLTSVPASPMTEWNPSPNNSHTWNSSTTTSSDSDLVPLPPSVTSFVEGLENPLPLHESIFTELYNVGSPDALEIDLVKSHSRAFLPKKIDNIKSWLHRAYVLTILRSYPGIILSGRRLPPFIHPYCSMNTIRDSKQAERDTRSALAGPLAICESIVQMFKARNKENNSFVWSTVRGAHEKLARELAFYNDWDTVAALQAVTVYFLLRISVEEDTEDEDLDIQLIRTMVKISLKVNGISRTYATMSGSSVPRWQDWIITESIRRTTTVLLLIERLFDIRAGLPQLNCDGAYLRSMVLPCSKKLWKAENESAWETEYFNNIRAQGYRDCFRYKDLMNLDSSASSSKYLWQSPLDGWLAQMDDLGNLIVAAASLGL